jgi:Cu-processing system ATP-binding protein
MIRIEKLTKKFRKLTALNGVSVSFANGEVTALIGPNGSGKTTLIKSILGIVKPDSGKVYIGGIDIKNNVNYKANIGYMPQIGRYPDNMQVRHLIDMIKDIRKASRLDHDLYDAYHIEAVATKTMQSLSGGTRQKVNATLAFLFDPEVLILDEPTAGLDPVASEILKAKIVSEAAKGKLILITSHILSDLEEFASNIVYLQDGNIMLCDSLANIQDYTGENRLGKAIAKLIQHGFPMNKRQSQLK